MFKTNSIFKLVKKLYLRWLTKTYSHLVEKRKDDVREWVFILAGKTYTHIQFPLVIENGKINLYTTVDEDFPVFDFFLPKSNLFIVLENPTTLGWEKSKDYGVPREHWELQVANKQLLFEKFPLKATERVNNLLYIPWDSATDEKSLNGLYEKALS